MRAVNTPQAAALDDDSCSSSHTVLYTHTLIVSKSFYLIVLIKFQSLIKKNPTE